MEHELVAEGIMKQYGVRQVLTDCYVTCRTGEVVGLLGRNGCGKSTMLEIIYGVRDAEQAQVRVDGRLYNSPFREKDLLAFLPQGNFIPNGLTISDLVKIFKLEKDQVDKLLSYPRIKELLNLRIGSMSVGQSKYAGLMLLLHTNAKFILMDEPFSGLDPLIAEEVIGILRRYKNKGIILTDHNYRHVLNCCTRFMVLHEGAIHQVKDPQEDLIRFNYLPPGAFDQ
jgi:ABC-type multidrug transport system ATPase subunit